MKVYKQTLPLWVNKPFEIELDGVILTAKLQHNNIVIYYTPDEETSRVYKYDILLCETGVEIEELSNPWWEYLDTLMMFGGDYVLHCFAIEKITEPTE